MLRSRSRMRTVNRLNRIGGGGGSSAVWLPSSLTGYVGSPFSVAYFRGLGTLWQDTAKTIPATADGDPVRVAVCDGVDWTAPSDAARPLLWDEGGGKWSFYFDGVDDQLIAADIAFAAGGETVFARLILEASNSYDMAVTTCRFDDVLNGGNLRFPSNSGRPAWVWAGTNTGGGEDNTIAAGTTTTMLGGGYETLTGRTTTGGVWSIRQAGTLRDTRTVVTMTARTARCRLGSRADGLFFSGRTAGVVICNAEVDDADILTTETYLTALA